MDKAGMSGMDRRDRKDIPNSLRGLWTFLLYTLIGPLFGALATVALYIADQLMGTGLLAHPLPEDVVGRLGPGAAIIGVAAFVWCAVPATLAGLGVLVFVLRNGTVGWIEAGICGVLAFTIAVVILPIGYEDLLPYLAFLFGLISILCRGVLIRGGILKVA